MLPGRERRGQQREGAGLGIVATWTHFVSSGIGNSQPLPFGALVGVLCQCFARSSFSDLPETSSALISAHSVRVSLLIWGLNFCIGQLIYLFTLLSFEQEWVVRKLQGSREWRVGLLSPGLPGIRSPAGPCECFSLTRSAPIAQMQ